MAEHGDDYEIDNSDGPFVIPTDGQAQRTVLAIGGAAHNQTFTITEPLPEYTHLPVPDGDMNMWVLHWYKPGSDPSERRPVYISGGFDDETMQDCIDTLEMGLDIDDFEGHQFSGD